MIGAESPAATAFAVAGLFLVHTLVLEAVSASAGSSLAAAVAATLAVSAAAFALLKAASRRGPGA